MTGRRENGSSLPSPAGDGVYRFAERLWELHERRPAPSAARPTGRMIVALEPHPDDLALSAGGRLAIEQRPLLVVSIFSDSVAVHPRSELGDHAPARRATVRREENRAALAELSADVVELGMEDAQRPYAPHRRDDLDRLVRALAAELNRLSEPEVELLAPAAVTRHPDHVLVHQAARQLGCRWFWEDVAFFPTYARCVEDRRWFMGAHGRDLRAEAFDITDAALAKVSMLSRYRSQAPSMAEVCGILRYAWSVADEEGALDRFMERSYRLS